MSAAGGSPGPADAPHGVARVSPRDLADRLRAGEDLVVLDVRRHEAWGVDPGRVPGALWVPLEEVPGRVRDLPADARLVVYCD
jgi:rhodanese-related sulfurtransferase